jgi:Glycosyl hydrolases family 25
VPVASAQGRDYSAYQRPVQPSDLAGLSFAYTRVSDWGGPDGNTMGTDPNFAADWAAIKAAGLHRGAYWFLQLSVSPVAQAAYFAAAVRKAGLLPGDLMVCDSEIPGANADAVTLAFLRELAVLTGWPAALLPVYSNLSVAKTLVATSREFPALWIAWPSPTATAPVPAQWAPAAWRTWRFWQYGTAAGVDADAFNGTAPELDAWIASSLPQPRPPVIAPEETMMIVTVDPATVPKGTAWPGSFSRVDNPAAPLGMEFLHIPDPARLAALRAAGVTDAKDLLPYADWLLLSGKVT